MKKSDSVKPIHHHVFLGALALGIICLFGFVIYPNIALLGGGGDAPTGLVATPGNEEVLLEWDPVLELNALPTGYVVYYTTSKISESVETGSTEASYTVTGLTNDAEYDFYITALFDHEESSPSEAVTATPSHIFCEGRGCDGGGGGVDDGGDSADPVSLSTEPQVVTTATSATITWATNVSASSQVVYGPTEDFSGNTPEYNTVERATGHSVEITGLTSCAGYWFKAVSYDAEANFAESTGGEFKTTGCKGDSEIVTYQAGSVSALSGTAVEAKVGGKGIRAVAPANLKSGIAEVGVEALKLQKSSVEPVISKPTGKEWIGEAYSLKAFQDEKTELEDNFDHPVEVTIDYTVEDVSGLDPASLHIYHYTDGIGWEALSSCTNDTNAMTVTCQTSSFSIFALFGSTSSTSAPTSSGPTQSGTAAKPVATNTPDTTPVAITNTSSATFNKNLSRGQKDSGVKALQIFLNNAGFTIASSGAGAPGYETDFFGPLTFAALVKFQEAHKNEILIPVGLTSGSGFFGAKTRAFINSL